MIGSKFFREIESQNMKNIFKINRENNGHLCALAISLCMFVLLTYSCKAIDQELKTKPEIVPKTTDELTMSYPNLKAFEGPAKATVGSKAEETPSKMEITEKKTDEISKPVPEAKATEESAKAAVDSKAAEKPPKIEIVDKTADETSKSVPEAKSTEEQPKPMMDSKLPAKPIEQKATAEKETFFVPYYKEGKLDFSGLKAEKEIKLTKEKPKLDVKAEKKDFQILAEDRFKGLAFQFWIPPSEYPEEHPEMKGYPRDAFGYPDWVAIVNRTLINPADSIEGNYEEEETFNEDIIFEINDRMMANVRFPHSTHTFWLSCKVCHPRLFIAKKGANDIDMTKIWSGKFCGRCHGAVAFLPKGFEACIRCHSVGRERTFFNF